MLRSMMVAIVLASLGCSTVPTVEQARALYAQQAACPDDRITKMVARLDLHPVDVLLGEADQQFVAEQLTPPAEIAADPVRAKLWKDGKVSALRAIWDVQSVFEFDACNHHGMLFCTLEPHRTSDSPTASCVASAKISRPSER